MSISSSSSSAASMSTAMSAGQISNGSDGASGQKGGITGAIGNLRLSSTLSRNNSSNSADTSASDLRGAYQTSSVAATESATRGGSTMLLGGRKRTSADMGENNGIPPLTRGNSNGGSATGGSKAVKSGVGSISQQQQSSQALEPLNPLVFNQFHQLPQQFDVHNQQQQQLQLSAQQIQYFRQQTFANEINDISSGPKHGFQHLQQQQQQQSPQQQQPSHQQQQQQSSFCDLTCLRVPICALRMERVGLSEWEVKETQVYDVEAFLQSITNSGSAQGEIPVCLVDDSYLQAELQTMRLEACSHGVVSLVQEMQLRKALCTSWPQKELPQFRNFVRAWQDSNASAQVTGGKSLHEFWRSRAASQSHNNATSLQQNATTRSQGLIVYEMSVTVGLLVRACPAVGLFEDIWCFVFPNEMAASSQGETFGAFLESQFPQLKTINNRLAYFHSGSGKALGGASSGSDVTVKYFAHKRGGGKNSGGASTGSLMDISRSNSSGNGEEAMSTVMDTPDQVPANRYQTIGTFSMPTTRVISRLQHGPLFHDFVLELLNSDVGGGGSVVGGDDRQ